MTKMGAAAPAELPGSGTGLPGYPEQSPEDCKTDVCVEAINYCVVTSDLPNMKLSNFALYFRLLS